MKSLPKLIVSVLVCEGIGLAGSVFTVPAIQTWYMGLNKPSFSPPNFLFAPVWTILYFLMGISLYLIWEQGIGKKKVREALISFKMQLLFNFLWSILFFGLHSPILGLLDIILLLVFIVITIKKFYPLSKNASYLLIPYLLWVTFATMLNLSIVLLNP